MKRASSNRLHPLCLIRTKNEWQDQFIYRLIENYKSSEYDRNHFHLSPPKSVFAAFFEVTKLKKEDTVVLSVFRGGFTLIFLL